MAARPLTIMVNVPLDGKLYRVRFEPRGQEHTEGEHAEPADMPAGLGSTEAERERYPRPHGRYTTRHALLLIARNFHPPICIQ